MRIRIAATHGHTSILLTAAEYIRFAMHFGYATSWRFAFSFKDF